MTAIFVLAAVFAVVAGTLAAMVVFGTAKPPPPLTVVSAPVAMADFSDVPLLLNFTARDGQKLTYRAYGGGGRAVILVHGSAGEGTVMHPAARTLAKAGFAVFVPTVRGHGGDGRLGDIDYLGQLDDDLADFVLHIREILPGVTPTLVGHSAGGGFVLRVAEGPQAGLFDRFVLLAPALAPTSPVFRPECGQWAVPYIPRLIGLILLGKLGIHGFDGLPVIAFAIPETVAVTMAPTYSLRLQRNFIAPDDYLKNLSKITRPIVLLVGTADELFFADRFAPLLHAVRSDIAIQKLPGIGHMTLILDPTALAALVAAVNRQP